MSISLKSVVFCWPELGLGPGYGLRIGAVPISTLSTKSSCKVTTYQGITPSHEDLQKRWVLPIQSGWCNSACPDVLAESTRGLPEDLQRR